MRNRYHELLETKILILFEGNETNFQSYYNLNSRLVLWTLLNT